MLIWRSLSPATIIACLNYITETARRRTAANAGGEALRPVNRPSDDKLRIDQATSEINSQL